MSKLTNVCGARANIHRRLLATVSAAAVLAYLYSAGEVAAADSDRPPIWIDFGGQLDRMDGGQAAFAPPFIAANSDSPAFEPISPIDAQRPPLYGKGLEGGITFEPNDSNWLFSASIRYGRSSGTKFVHRQTAPGEIVIHFGSSSISKLGSNYVVNFANTRARNTESYAIVDFTAGRDVGLGLFGSGSKSVLSAGVRFAQFTSKSTVTINADPDVTFPTSAFAFVYKYHHGYVFSGNRSRSFHGVGPSISWNASSPFAGDPQNGELAFDWGINAAILFGRQRASIHHQTTGQHVKYAQPQRTTLYQHAADHRRTRSISAPNIGGFAGLSYRIEGFKVALGYRADVFFGPMDGGIDTRKSENRGFYGPFASISVGLGD